MKLFVLFQDAWSYDDEPELLGVFSSLEKAQACVPERPRVLRWVQEVDGRWETVFNRDVRSAGYEVVAVTLDAVRQP